MFSILKKNKLLLTATLGSIILVSIFEIGKAELTSHVLNSVIIKTGSFMKWGTLFMGFTVCFCIMSFVQKKLVIQVKSVSWKSMNENLIRYYMQMGPGQFAKQTDASSLINEFNTKIVKIVTIYESAWLNLFYFGAGFLLGSIYIGIEQIGILLFIYIATLLTLFYNSRFANKMKEKQLTCVESEKEWIGMIKSFAQSFRTVKIYNYESSMGQKLDEKNQELTNSWNRFESFLKLLSASNDLFTQIVYFGILLIGVWMISRNRLTIGQLMGILQACNLVTMGMMNFSELYNQIQSSSFLLNEYLEKTQEDKNRKEKESKPVGFNEIEIRDLTFSYDGKKDILTDVNFRIQKGKKYLIIGESGQGKSTFLNLLLKNIETNSIFLDHKPIQELSYSVYVQNFACVYQNEPLLPGTLKENIVLNNKIDEYELIEKLHAFHLDSLIDRLDLPLQEDAPQISGGQLQKIHILRSLLSQRNILILDEAFSALDQENAKLIERMILEDANFTVLSVSHKITDANLAPYDEILEVKDGRIIRKEKGNQNLLRFDKKFWDLTDACEKDAFRKN